MKSDQFLTELFPTKWRNTLFAEDIESLLCLDRKIVIQKTKSVVGHPKWNLNKLRKLIDTKGSPLNEKWKLPEGDQHLLVWQDDCSFLSPPDAIMSFAFEIVEKTKNGHPSDICLSNNLVWVVPENRNKGLGYHLVAHFICYLQACKISYPFVSRRGVNIEFYSEYFSKGGECLSEQIASFLEYMHEAKCYWSIKSVELEIGY